MSAGILTHEEILAACGLTAADPESKETNQTGPIGNGVKANVRTASYDLRLGHDYYLHEESHENQVVISKLVEKEKESFVVPANRVVIVSTYETMNVPSDIVGHLSLKLDLLLKGLIMANQSQIDAGYKGQIFALLYNLSNQAVPLSLKQSVLRLELVRLPSETQTYRGSYQHKTLSQVLTMPVTSSLEQMGRDIETVKKDVESNRHRINWIAAIAALVTVLGAVAGYIGPMARAIDRAERVVDRVETLEKFADREEGHGDVATLRERVDELARKVVQLTTPTTIPKPTARAPRRGQPKRGGP